MLERGRGGDGDITNCGRSRLRYVGVTTRWPRSSREPVQAASVGQGLRDRPPEATARDLERSDRMSGRRGPARSGPDIEGRRWSRRSRGFTATTASLDPARTPPGWRCDGDRAQYRAQSAPRAARAGLDEAIKWSSLRSRAADSAAPMAWPTDHRRAERAPLLLAGLIAAARRNIDRARVGAAVRAGRRYLADAERPTRR